MENPPPPTPEKVKSAPLSVPLSESKIDPHFFQLLDEMDSWDIIEEPETYMRLISIEDLPELINIREEDLTSRQSMRRDLVAYMLRARKCPPIDEECSTPSISAEDFTVNVPSSSIAVPAFKPMRSPFESAVFALPLAEPRFPAPVKGKGIPSVDWDLGSPGPSRTLPDRRVRILPEKELREHIQCPIVDLDDRVVRKRIASYRTKVKVVTPKEERERLRSIARRWKQSMRDPMRGSCGHYEAQMHLHHHVNINPSQRMDALIDRVMGGFSSVMRDEVHGPAAAINKITNSLNRVSGSVDDSVFNREQFEGLLQGGAMKLLWCVPLIAAAYYTVCSVQRKNRAASLAGVGTMLAMLLPAGLWDAIKRYWPKKPDDDWEFSSTTSREEYETQAFCFEPDTMAHLLTAGLTYITCGRSDFLGIVKEFTKSMSNYSRNVSGWKDLSIFIVTTIERFVNFIRSKFNKDNLVLYQSGKRMVDEWCNRVMEVVNSSNTGGDIMTPENVEKMICLRNEGKDLAFTFRFTPEASPMLHKYLGYLDDLCRTCSAAMHMAKGGRAPPVVLAMRGEPGVGKTWLTKLITSYILSSIIPEDRARELGFNFDSQVFQKGTTEYWNGYAGQLAVIVDDFGQSVVVPGVENDFIDLIRMNSSWSYPLNFADLENKGKNFFCSKFLLLTTNIAKLDKCLSVINEPEAIARRIDFGYTVEVHPDFGIEGRIDIGKVKNYEEEHGEFPFHAWVLYRHKFAIGSDAHTDRTRQFGLKEVLDEVAGKLTQNESFHTATSESIRRALERKYETQMNSDFHDFLLHTAYGGVELNTRHNSFAGKILEKIHDCCDYVRREFDTLLIVLNQIMSHPLVEFAAICGGGFLFGGALMTLVTHAIRWFYSEPDEEKPVLKAALKKKKSIPEACIAQLLDAFEPEDFNDIIDDGNVSYVRTHRFSRKAVERMSERVFGLQPQSNEPSGNRFVYRKITANKVVEGDMIPQSDVYGDSIIEVGYRNMYQVQLRKEDAVCVIGNLVFVRDTCALAPLHYRKEFECAIDDGILHANTKVHLVNGINEKLSYQFTLGEFLQFPFSSLEDDDLSLMQFPRSVRAHRDIVDKFVYDSDIKSLNKIRVRLDTIEGKEQFIHRVRHIAARRKDCQRVSSDSVSYVLATGFEYLGFTRKGDCGGLVGLEDAPDKQGRRLLGIHVAGQPSMEVGLCNIITQEKLNILLSKFDVIEDKFYEMQNAMPLVDSFVEGSFLGLNKSEKIHNLNPMTSHVKTKLFASWGNCVKVTAPLKPFMREGVKINPMRNALKPYASPVHLLDPDEVDRATYQVFNRLSALTGGQDRRIYTFEEACAGIAGTDVNGIPRNTSPGYPWVTEGYNNKKRFFGKSDEYTFDSPDCIKLREEVDKVLKEASEGVRNVHVFIDFLKDELRSPEKAELGMTRLISSAPLVYTVAFRMMFLAFTVAIQRTRVRNGIAVGINAYTEWDYLARELKSKGDKCVAGDFKGFDSSEQPEIHWSILDAINAWYDDGPLNARIRRVLWMEVVHSRHLGGLHGTLDVIYQWNKSLPSGHPATSIINSVYNQVLFQMSWTRIMGRPLASKFAEYVYLCVYGDDNVLNIADCVVDKFNQRTISETMADLGMIYTSENKTSMVEEFRPLSEVSFLKRGFRFEDRLNKYVGPQELESILYVPYWCKNKSMIDEITLANVEFTYTELSLHGDEIWNFYAPKIRASVYDAYGTLPVHRLLRRDYLLVSQETTMVWPL